MSPTWISLKSWGIFPYNTTFKVHFAPSKSIPKNTLHNKSWLSFKKMLAHLASLEFLEQIASTSQVGSFFGYLSCLMFRVWGDRWAKVPPHRRRPNTGLTHSFCGGFFPLPRRAGFIDFADLFCSKNRKSTYLAKNSQQKPEESPIHLLYTFWSIQIGEICEQTDSKTASWCQFFGKTSPNTYQNHPKPHNASWLQNFWQSTGESPFPPPPIFSMF